jgi:hypothetical protein
MILIKCMANSLSNYKPWNCIKINNPISIFESLSEKLRKKIFYR